MVLIANEEASLNNIFPLLVNIFPALGNPALYKHTISPHDGGFILVFTKMPSDCSSGYTREIVQKVMDLLATTKFNGVVVPYGWQYNGRYFASLANFAFIH